MTTLYLDIESIPAQSEAVRQQIADSVKPPASMKKADTIAAWEAEQKPAAVEEAIAKTALNGALGHICCIGWAVDNLSTGSFSMTEFSPENEADIITNFFCSVDQYIDQYRATKIVGHYVVGFDIRFIWQRCIVLGIRAPSWLPRDPKPWDANVFDTMTAWAGARDTISLDNLCRALGIEGKGDIDGSMVGKMFAEGRHDEIAAYCRQDVERVRAVHRKMRLAFGEAA
ncbi:ribonuclease H-like domain-containing protein [Rhizobium alvei]|uniref:Ribonuclease H-like domain-containing protein n=1 Tax=Rhizobium alvei TaxID=1132659 RepID=A0ABT8YT51_9HYPH|nr:ribonuclease H-like domain-containing protein [Rhizobium alvei]MDO6966942.1 ribonuclease H-like domain-containing protein [Rhizobium alvei]